MNKVGLSCWFIDHDNKYLVFSENKDKSKVTVVKRIIDEVNGDKSKEITFTLPRDIGSDSGTANADVQDVVKKNLLKHRKAS